MSKLFAFGLFLLISNFLVGKAAIPLFAINFFLGLGVYLFSWLMLLAGLMICGKEGWHQAVDWYKTREKRFILSIKHRFR